MKQVLLIDDDRDDAELFKEALSEIDGSIAFEHCEDSRHVLKNISGKQDNLPDIIFLDINMPIVSGWECLAELKKTNQLKDIPVIMFSTSSQTQEKELATKLGAVGFVTKPSDYQSLKNLLVSILKN